MMKATSRITDIRYAVEFMSLEYAPTFTHISVKKE